MRFVRHSGFLTATLSLLLSSVAFGAIAPPYAAHQSVPDGELLRWIYTLTFPTQCPAAGQAVRNLRVKPTTSPTAMHATANAFLECAKTDWAKAHNGLYNMSVFGAAAAALIAARHEPPAAALNDAHFAKKVSAAVASYTSPNSNYINPSKFRTEANQINADATALIAALKG